MLPKADYVPSPQQHVEETGKGIRRKPVERLADAREGGDMPTDAFIPPKAAGVE